MKFIKENSRRIITAMWILFGLCLAGVTIFLYLVYNGVIGYMPPVEELKNPKDRFASIVYSADGEELGRYFNGTGNRVYVDFDDISQNVIDALIATEDSRFEDHSGIDLRALGRVAVKTVIMGQKNAGGGSTITQQLAKLLYSPSSDGLMQRALQKPIEWMIAVKLERFYSKDEIIKMYLNQFDFLYNAVGIKSAAYVYFGKDPKDLNIQEAATLVGMVKNPSYYNPVRKPERTRDRRNVVLEQMYKEDMISKAELDSLRALPLELNFHRVDHKEGPAPYFREELRRMLRAKHPVRSDYRGWEKQKFIDDSIAWETNPLYGWIEKNPKPDGTRYDIYTDGLKIYTTIDSRMQRYAEEAVTEHLGQTLQPSFFREKKGVKGAPYTTNREELSSAQLVALIDKAVKQTDRYYQMKKAGASEAEIKKAFATKQDMKVFSYNGMINQQGESNRHQPPRHCRHAPRRQVHPRAERQEAVFPSYSRVTGNHDISHKNQSGMPFYRHSGLIFIYFYISLWHYNTIFLQKQHSLTHLSLSYESILLINCRGHDSRMRTVRDGTDCDIGKNRHQEQQRHRRQSCDRRKTRRRRHTHICRNR